MTKLIEKQVMSMITTQAVSISLVMKVEIDCGTSLVANCLFLQLSDQVPLGTACWAHLLALPCTFCPCAPQLAYQ